MTRKGSGPRQEFEQDKESSITKAFFENESFIKRFLSHFLVRTQDIEDVAQETFLKGFAAEKDREIHSPKAFLFQIARNIALKKLTKKARLITSYIEDLGDPEVLCEGASVEEQVAAREKLAVFCKAAASLPPQCRRAFLLRKVYGFSHREVSEMLGISISTVEKHMANGLQRCSHFMRDEGQLENKLTKIDTKGPQTINAAKQ